MLSNKQLRCIEKYEDFYKDWNSSTVEDAIVGIEQLMESGMSFSKALKTYNKNLVEPTIAEMNSAFNSKVSTNKFMGILTKL